MIGHTGLAVPPVAETASVTGPAIVIILHHNMAAIIAMGTILKLHPVYLANALWLEDGAPGLIGPHVLQRVVKGIRAVTAPVTVQHHNMEDSSAMAIAHRQNSAQTAPAQRIIFVTNLALSRN